MPLIAHSVDLTNKKVTVKSLQWPSLEDSKFIIDGNQFYMIFNFPYETIPGLSLVQKPDPYKVEFIEYTINETIPNGHGNALLASTDYPPTIGYTKSEDSYQDKNGVTKFLLDVARDLDVNITRAVDDNATMVTIEGSSISVESKEFTLLILNELNGKTGIYKITSPLPGESRTLVLKLPAVTGGRPITFTSPIHVAVQRAMLNPGVVMPFELILNIRYGQLSVNSGVLVTHDTKDKKLKMIITILPPRLNFYTNNDNNINKLLAQAYTMKVYAEAVNNEILLTTGVSTLDYSYSTSSVESINVPGGVVHILPQMYTPYLNGKQLETRNCVVNDYTIGFAINVNDKEELRGSGSFDSEYFD